MLAYLHKILIEHTVYPAMERVKGNRIRAMARCLEETTWEGAEEVQRKRLRELLLTCAAHVPAYREIGGNLVQSDPAAALRTAPPLRKAEFQRNETAYLSDAVPISARIPNCTGGSTGEPIHFVMTRDQVEAYEAARWRGLSWYGVTQGSRCAMLWGNPVELSAQKQLRYRLRERLLKNRVVLSAYDLTSDRLHAHIRFLNRYRPEYLYGYANILTAFAQGMEQEDLHLSCSLKVVVSTSETLEPWQKALLERVFRCPVANEYGARDAGILAYSCPECGSLHIVQENCLLEILNPRTLEPVKEGQSGLIAVTDLCSRAQPRLRYLLGDVGVLRREPCPCGRKLPVLERVEGREDALLLRRDGGLVHGNVIGQLLRPMQGILAFQFTQTSVTEGVLLLKMAPQSQPDEAELREKLHRVLPDLRLTIQQVDEIPTAPSGKRRYAIRAFPLPVKNGMRK